MCEACAEAAKTTTHLFLKGCTGCDARMVSRSPDFKRVRELGKLDAEYASILTRFNTNHESVKAAHAADAMNREMTQ